MDYSKKTLSQLQAELDRLFSLYVRQLHADDRGFVRCITCNFEDHWRNVDAGHFISRKFLKTRFSLLNVYPQCRVCNRHKDGDEIRYRKKLIQLHGEQEVKNLEEISKRTFKMDRVDYITGIEIIKNKLKDKGFKIR